MMKHGTYLDYSINIHVTGLTGGATASEIYIGSYKRSTSGGYMGMISDFVHSETSGYPQNSVLSWVLIQPFDASGVGYPGFVSDSGTNASVTNKVSDWRYIGGTGGWPNWLSIKGDVNWPITGYSIIGHIYLYSVPVLELTGIEVTQVVQDLDNSVPLIADKPTYVRAYFRTTIPQTTITDVTVSLSAYQDGVLLGTMSPNNISNGFLDVSYYQYFTKARNWRSLTPNLRQRAQTTRGFRDLLIISTSRKRVIGVL